MKKLYPDYAGKSIRLGESIEHDKKKHRHKRFSVEVFSEIIVRQFPTQRW